MSKPVVRSTNPEIILDQHSLMPLYRQLYVRFRAEILAGQLKTGTRLPSTRVLASELGVSRNTTALAYELLLLEGYIEGKVGDGTRVAYQQPQPKTPDSNPPTTGLSVRSQLLLNTPYPGELYANPQSASTRLFRAGQPDVSFFPFKTWAGLVAKHANRSLPGASHYQQAQGYLPLREAIATHIGITRGVHCSPDQIILTAGSQGALDLVARVLLDPGDLVWVEDPGYLGARGALLAAGASLVPVAVDEEGLEVDTGRKLCPAARLAVVTPSHQFPTGVTMSLSRRLALLEWARASQSWIIEDDYDSEYRFSGRPLEALQGLDNNGRVIYIGTFSKVLFPSLRLGYLIVPTKLLNGFIATRRFIDVHIPLLEQMALADFITEGHFARHLRKMRLLYLERRDALVEALKQELDDMEVTIPEAGMHLVAWLPPGMNGRVTAQLARLQELYLVLISQSCQKPFPREGLMLGFANNTPEELRAGVKKLALAIRSG